LDLIKLCKWKNDAKTCVNFSFDDGLHCFRKISQIFDLYGFKATFFVIANTLQVDSIKDMSTRGHEIANHSYSHPLFEVMDSIGLDYQIRKGQEILENALGIKCVTFGEPGNFKSQLCAEITFKYHLFDRHYSEYPEVNRIELDLQQDNMDSFIPFINNAISSGLILQVVSHGIDGEGYRPLTGDLIAQELNSVKSLAESGDVWVTTVKEGLCYENLYHDLTLDKSIHGDTLYLNFLNYNIEKYKDLVASPISIQVPKSICKAVSCLTDFVEVKELSDKFVVTTDLKRDTTLVFVLKNN
jgi:peptidoglycan/xylan/chitin deacetylase (PgdA/CDA1 family)